MQKNWLTGRSGKFILTFGGTALLLAGCAHKPAAPPVVFAPPPPPPVGHVYAVAVNIPPPVSPRIKFSSAAEEQAQQAFNVIGLRSALMVASLYCNGQDDKYNAFLTSFRPHILAAQHIMDAYFRKASGPYSGRDMEDNFTTLLANSQSDNGIHEGSLFCLNNQAEFNAVLALKTPADLDRFVTDQAPLPASAPASVPAH